MFILINTTQKSAFLCGNYETAVTIIPTCDTYNKYTYNNFAYYYLSIFCLTTWSDEGKIQIIIQYRHNITETGKSTDDA